MVSTDAKAEGDALRERTSVYQLGHLRRQSLLPYPACRVLLHECHFRSVWLLVIGSAVYISPDAAAPLPGSLLG